MATSLLPSPATGSFHGRLAGSPYPSTHECSYTKLSSFGKMSSCQVLIKSKNQGLTAFAKSRTGGGGGGDFVAGFVLGGAVFGALAYVFAPQIRRALLNEDEYGFRKARRPIYYEDDDGLEKTRKTLNAKLGQLNTAIDNVSSRLRGGGNKVPQVPVEAVPEVETTI